MDGDSKLPRPFTHFKFKSSSLVHCILTFAEDVTSFELLLGNSLAGKLLNLMKETNLLDQDQQRHE